MRVNAVLLLLIFALGANLFYACTKDTEGAPQPPSPVVAEKMKIEAEVQREGFTFGSPMTPDPEPKFPLFTDYNSCKMTLRLNGDSECETATVTLAFSPAPGSPNPPTMTLQVSKWTWQTITLPINNPYIYLKYETACGNTGTERISVRFGTYGFNRRKVTDLLSPGFAYNFINYAYNHFLPYIDEQNYICDRWCTWNSDVQYKKLVNGGEALSALAAEQPNNYVPLLMMYSPKPQFATPLDCDYVCEAPYVYPIADPGGTLPTYKVSNYVSQSVPGVYDGKLCARIKDLNDSWITGWTLPVGIGDGPKHRSHHCLLAENPTDPGPADCPEGPTEWPCYAPE